MSSAPWLEDETRNRIRYELKTTTLRRIDIAHIFGVSLGTVTRIAQELERELKRPRNAPPSMIPGLSEDMLRAGRAFVRRNRG